MSLSFEDVRYCPKCQQPGEHTKTVRIDRFGSKSLIFTCRNNLCPWHNTQWPADQRPDGTFIEPSTTRPKRFPKVPDLTERVQNQIDRQISTELESGGGRIE